MTRALAALAASMIAALAAGSLAGCVRYVDQRRAAPGRADLATPPPNLAAEELDPPRDPGERTRSLSISLLGGGGGRFPNVGRDQAVRALYVGVLQVGARFGESESSRRRLMQSFPLLLPDATDESWGFHVGWTFLQAGSLPTSGSALHVEVDRAVLRGFFRAALGYAVSFYERAHGPQLTLGLGPFFMRARHLFGAGGELVYGVDLSFLYAWVSTR